MTRTNILTAGLLALGAGIAPAQTGLPSFEVASIRTGAPFSMDLLRAGGVGMKMDAGRVVIRSWSLADIIGAAYRVRTDQLSGPDWMGLLRFEIQAKMPEGARQDQVPEMLQSLLAERFKMVARRGQKVMAVYALTTGKNPPKLKETAEEDKSAPTCNYGSGNHRLCRHMTMEDLANLLTQMSKMFAAMPPGGMTWGIEMPAVDLTGLKGTYDFALDYGPGGPEIGGGPITEALERIGLKLDAQKRPYEVIFVDHLEKAPTEN